MDEKTLRKECEEFRKVEGPASFYEGPCARPLTLMLVNAV